MTEKLLAIFLPEILLRMALKIMLTSKTFLIRLKQMQEVHTKKR